MYKFSKLKQGFLNTLKEDMIMTWQEVNETDQELDLYIPDVWDGMIENLLTDITNQLQEEEINELEGSELEKGGGLYIGLMYDSYDTPLDKLRGIDWYSDLTPFTSYDGETIEFEGYIQFNGVKYS